MKTLNLASYDVKEMDEAQMSEVNGGGIVADIWELVKEIDEGWDNFKQRLVDGWNSYGCSCHCG